MLIALFWKGPEIPGPLRKKPNTSKYCVQVKLVSADPAPPLRGMNTWQVQVEDGSGNPIDGAMVSVDLYMPDHGHSSPTTPTVTAQSNGAYEISNLNFFMPGVWRARFTVTRDTTTELVDFFFCVAG